MRRGEIRDQRAANWSKQLPLFDVPEATWRGLPQPGGVQISDFKWMQGEDLITFYGSSPAVFRGFCRVCGSPIINKFNAGSPITERDPDAPSRYGIALATLDDDPGVRPLAHIFVASKAPWFTITDDLPQFAEARPRTTG